MRWARVTENDIELSGSLKPIEFRVLMVLRLHARPDGTFPPGMTPKVSTIAGRLGCKDRFARRGLQGLIAAGVVAKTGDGLALPNGTVRPASAVRSIPPDRYDPYPPGVRSGPAEGTISTLEEVRSGPDAESDKPDCSAAGSAVGVEPPPEKHPEQTFKQTSNRPLKQRTTPDSTPQKKPSQKRQPRAETLRLRALPPADQWALLIEAERGGHASLVEYLRAEFPAMDGENGRPPLNEVLEDAHRWFIDDCLPSRRWVEASGIVKWFRRDYQKWRASYENDIRFSRIQNPDPEVADPAAQKANLAEIKRRWRASPEGRANRDKITQPELPT